MTPPLGAQVHAHANPHVEAGLSSPPSPRVLRSTTSLQRKHAHPQAHAPAQAQGQALAATGNVQPERRTWSRQLSGIVPLTRFGRSDADRTMAALHGASQALQEHANSMPAPDEVCCFCWPACSLAYCIAVHRQACSISWCPVLGHALRS